MQDWTTFVHFRKGNLLHLIRDGICEPSVFIERIDDCCGLLKCQAPNPLSVRSAGWEDDIGRRVNPRHYLSTNSGINLPTSRLDMLQNWDPESTFLSPDRMIGIVRLSQHQGQHYRLMLRREEMEDGWVFIDCYSTGLSGNFWEFRERLPPGFPNPWKLKRIQVSFQWWKACASLAPFFERRTS